MSWYTKSYGWIQQQKLDNSDLGHAELKKHCSKNYPFSERKGWAYKAWLKAMRDYFGAARKPRPSAQSDLFLEAKEMRKKAK